MLILASDANPKTKISTSNTKTMGGVLGTERPNDARRGKYNFDNMRFSMDGCNPFRMESAVSYSGAASNQKYLDHIDSAQTVCSGTPKLFTMGLGILEHDTVDGNDGTYVMEGIGLAPVKSSDTPSTGDFLYWDDTNKYLTTTSGGNSKAAIAAEGYADWRTGSDANPTDNPVVSGRKWGRVYLRPML